MFRWLFGKKRRKKTRGPKNRLYSYKDLAAEFFYMEGYQRVIVLELLKVPCPIEVVRASKPTSDVKSLVASKSGRRLKAEEFIDELCNLLDANKVEAIVGVFQQICRDLKEAHKYAERFKKLYG